MGSYISSGVYSQEDEKYMAIIKHLEYRISVLEGHENPIPPKKALPRLRPKLQHDIKHHKLKKTKKQQPKPLQPGGGLMHELSKAIVHRRERIAPVTYPDVYTWEEDVINGLPL
tara:strand:+ start:607 stop:948 length:342 start_codon:yes stop_codon:yes gene_type:complete